MHLLYLVSGKCFYAFLAPGVLTKLSNSYLVEVKAKELYIPLLAVLVMLNTEHHLRFKGP